ncbi:hypothetical protein AVEN_140333-1 [Araneus ventricosus]|uniref:Uncharacterized protein n=1 Tax=Araneus ventricosus TaxID=182803 RepID=A0A4Y2FFK2_ARAVE|nr:hypothetical protein AVEN_140333-1 [Araneus ventricosus]
MSGVKVSPTAGTTSYDTGTGEGCNEIGLKFSPDLYLSTCWIPRSHNGEQKFPRLGGRHSIPNRGALTTYPSTGVTSDFIIMNELQNNSNIAQISFIIPSTVLPPREKP